MCQNYNKNISMSLSFLLYFFLVFMCVLFGFAGHTFGTNTPIKSIGGCCCDDGGISLT